MSDQAHILSVEVFADLRAAFMRFGNVITELCSGLEKQIEIIECTLEQQQRLLQECVDQAHEQMQAAQRELLDCERSDEEGDASDCNEEEEQLRHAENVLQQCETNWERAKQLQHQVEAQVVEWERRKHELLLLTNEERTPVQSFFSHKLQTLEGYLTYFPSVDSSRPETFIVDAAMRSTVQPSADTLHYSGTDEERLELQAGMRLLGQLEIGRRLIAVLHDLGAEIRFGTCADREGKPCFGSYTREPAVLTLSALLIGRSALVIAAHLAHEATHAKWNRPGSLSQEYDAFKTQAFAWILLKRNYSTYEIENDPQVERVCGIIQMGEDRAKQIIALHYPNLPPT